MEEKNITINIESSPSILDLKIISINGILDTVTSKYVDEKVFPIIDKEVSNIIMVLTNLNYISSIGINCLLKYLALFTDKKRLLKLVKPPKHIYDTFVITGIAKRFDMYDSIEAAIDSFR
jgi:anti-anti-sigma factor